MTIVDKDQVEERLTSGILGQWYVVAKSVQVKPGRPHAVKVLGRNLVLWRDGGGRAPLSRRLLPAPRRADCRAARSSGMIFPAATTA